ncbi:hypothetical protein MFIFM68171_03173 [Madurella fahalii]|uniref:Peptidase A1 domain-containing protein n=1 Tax=Madurella fahalii TaxID=1157608 RepID=A0ABQ0G5C4_9PEZI
MLRVSALLLQLTLWVAAVHAFFPFIPDDHCDPDEHCGPFGPGSKRNDGGPAQISKGVTFDLVHKPRNPDHDSNIAIAEAIGRVNRKYGRVEPSHVHRGQPELGRRVNGYSVSEPMAPTAPNSAGIYQYGPDYSYFIKAQVGSAKQSFYMLLDTGAANSWLMGSDCQSDACKIHNTLNPSSSKTWRTERKAFSISYGSGDLTGIVGHDTVSLAGFNLDMSFGLANYTHNDFKHFAFDGILGLTMSASVTGTFLQMIKAKKLLDPLMFSVSLNRDSDGRNDGQVTFGGVDKTKYTGDITYTSVRSPEKGAGEWAIPLAGVGANGKPSGVTNRLAYIDTGTSFVFAPPDDLAALFKLIPGATSYKNGDYVEYKVPCNTKLPISLTFSGVTYDISPADWVVGKGDHCISRLYGYEIKQGTWLLGDTFLKNVYSVFDADQMRIGFASKPAPPPKPTSTSAGLLATTAAAPVTPSASGDSARPIMPGSSGQETMPGSVAVETTTGAATNPTQTALGDRLRSSPCLLILCIAAVMAMAA